MSLLWPERLTLLIHPQRVLLERRDFRGRVACEVATALPVADAAVWQGALSAALVLLERCGRRGSRLRIVVADHFVRYALLPWSETMCRPAERRAVALALFRSSLGEKADALEIAVEQARFGQNGMAAAIDRELLDALRTAARKRWLSLVGIQPRLVSELATETKTAEPDWFASIDDGWLSLLGMHAGQLACLHNHRSPTDDPVRRGAELGGLLRDGRIVVPGQTLSIACAGNAPLPLPGEWKTSVRPYRLHEARHAPL